MTKIEKAKETFDSLSAYQKRKTTLLSVGLRKKMIERPEYVLHNKYSKEVIDSLPYCNSKERTLDSNLNACLALE